MPACDSPSHDHVRLSSAEVRALAAIEAAEDDPRDERWGLRGIRCRVGRLVARGRGGARRVGRALAETGLGRTLALTTAVVLGAIVPVVLVILIGIVVVLVGVGVAAGVSCGSSRWGEG
jgi:hypothetical protein